MPGQQVSNVEVVGQRQHIYLCNCKHQPYSSTIFHLLYGTALKYDYNGNKHVIQLDAFGQNAHFFRNRKSPELKSGTTICPYVILGGTNG